MSAEFRYRFASIAGTIFLVILAVVIANSATVQTFVTTEIPVINQLYNTVLSPEKIAVTGVITVLFVTGSLIPMFKPRPRRILDILFITEKRLLVAILGLATIGYFDYSYRHPRSTLIIITVLLGVSLPVLFVAIRRRPTTKNERAIIVGDDIRHITDVLEVINTPVLGYISPPSGNEIRNWEREQVVTDGGTEQPLSGIKRLGGLSRLENILLQNSVDVAILAFSTTDRAEFFGALDTCYKHGITAKAPNRHIDSVLTKAEATEDDELVEIALEPWDWQDYLIKRIFDILFASASLLVLAPLLGIITLAIKLDSPGPVFYNQVRTAELGGTFQVYKFRTMLPDSESAEPEEDETNNRITRVGRVLRKTHLDEIPQLWTILTGGMSVVGPRATWTEEEQQLEAEVDTWRKRWFVKPGLTGLAQVHEVNSTDPKTKLRFDLEYIRRQSFWFDVKIVIRQIWNVIKDTIYMFVEKKD
ncbi:Sugar transferase involved in LPS biosynthesis (colanic, teichoic acid) [Haladaptatus litoreus]|uniref:Sugar transferase involved in LPS biosynthesis (Colanic, teichoic acid) n=1 Tax=Haladaptatus litoreus TaxID=553468 RepID=A0A1N7DC82_9EURY|nr:sugar transferase [Haladaptatus litoreus]SIR73418.1 Sugar transferase involved in LPS biosynthesis (colanic, teichoic acid) [Haladaptatus litoreus]